MNITKCLAAVLIGAGLFAGRDGSAATLPKGYTECEYISVTDARQYILTGIMPDEGLDIRMTFSVPNFNGTTTLIWSRQGNNCAYGLILPAGVNAKGQKIRAYRQSNGDAGLGTFIDGSLLSAETPITYVTEGGSFWLDDAQYNLPDTYKVGNPIPEICIFRLWELNGPVPGLYSGITAVVGTKLYALSFYRNGECVNELVPCVTTIGGQTVAGLYDTHREKFCGNSDSSSGTFGYVVKAVTSSSLTVVGLPVNAGSPSPAYCEQEEVPAGEEVVATMPETHVVDYLTGEERELLGWRLNIVSAAGTTTTESTEETRACCVFTPQEGETITLSWLWSQNPYGPDVLPEGYAANEYLETTSAMVSPFVLADYTPELDDQMVAVVELTACAADSTYCLLCSRDASAESGQPRQTLFVKNGAWELRNSAAAAVGGLGSVAAGDKMAVALNGGSLFVNGTLLSDAFAGQTGASSGPLTLLAGYAAADAQSGRVYETSDNMRAKIYAFRAWDKDGSPKASMLPCTRESDGAVGLYDTVRKRFFKLLDVPTLNVTGMPTTLGSPSPAYGLRRIVSSGSALTKDFAVDATQVTGRQTAPLGEATYEVSGWELKVTAADGSVTTLANDPGEETVCSFAPYFGESYELNWMFDVAYLKPKGPHLPERYTEAEWIKFPTRTGAALHHILTDYVPRLDKDRITIDFELSQETAERVTSACIFCSRWNSKNGCYSLFCRSGKLEARYQDSTATLSPDQLVGVRQTYVFDPNVASIKNQPGVEATVGTIAAAGARAGGPLCFGTAYSITPTGEIDVNDEWCDYKLFGVKVSERTDNGYTLIHKYLPCFDRLTGVSGLYDTVEGKFFPNHWNEIFEFAPKKFLGLVLMVR